MLAGEFLDLLDAQLRSLVSKHGRGQESEWKGTRRGLSLYKIFVYFEASVHESIIP